MADCNYYEEHKAINTIHLRLKSRDSPLSIIISEKVPDFDPKISNSNAEIEKNKELLIGGFELGNI